CKLPKVTRRSIAHTRCRAGDFSSMRSINRPVPSSGRNESGWATLVETLALGSLAALLMGANSAAAQDINVISPFSNSGTHTGDVLSNTSTIDNDGPSGIW